MGFSHRARASNDGSVRRCIRSLRRSEPLALSASGLIAGENDVKHTPSLRRAPRGRKANPRKENEVCSCSPSVAVLAIDDPRLVGVKPKPHLSHPRGDPGSLLFAHASEQALHSYYRPVRQRASQLVLSAFGFCLGTLPLATVEPAAPDDGFERSPSHVPCKSRRPGSRRLYAGHHLANTRAPARLISKENSGPRFRCQLTYLSTPQQRTPTRISRTSASGTSSWSPPDAITPRLLPGRSPRRSSTNAAPGRLSACPRRPTLEGQQASISCTAPPIYEESSTRLPLQRS